MNNGTDWQGKFAQGFTSTGYVDSGLTLLVFFAVLVILGALWFFYDQYKKYQALQPKKKPAQAGAPVHHGPKFVPVPGRMNPLQQKIIQEMINEFRQQETAAQAVPSAILEKYSEFFFNNIKRMKTNDKEVEEFVNKAYPLEDGFTVEMDFQSPGALHLIKSKVLEASGRNLIIEFNNQIPGFLKKGMHLHLNYSVGKHFLQGATTIVDIQPSVGLIIKRPTEVVLTSERRYNRLNLKKGSGTLHEPLSDTHSPVKVLDISLEGVRVQVGRPLEKSKIYQLTFETEDGGRPVTFGPVECAPSKAFLTGSGTYETGLVFLYLDVPTKARLLQFMKHLVQEMQAAAQAAQGPEPKAETPAPKKPAAPAKAPRS